MIPVKAVISGDSDAEMELDGFFESPEDDPPKVLCMLKLIVDESIDDKTELCLVAGYLGNKRQWSDYVNAWCKERHPRKSLHVADMRLGSPQAPKRHGDLLSRLGIVPEKCGLRAFSGSICRKDYCNKVSGTVLEIMMDGYVLSILALMDVVAKNIHPNERVEVFFEEQEAHAVLRERAMIAWRKIHKTKSGWSVLARWGSVPKGTLTEASDYLCYALQQFFVDQTSQKAILTASILKQDIIGNHTSKETIDEWLRIVSSTRVIPKLTAENRQAIRSR